MPTKIPPECYHSDPDPTSSPMLRIECVVTSVNCGDYLAETLPFLKAVFDRVIVSTSNDDGETLELCRRLSTPCYATGVMNRPGEPFNKARGINHALKYIQYHDWVCQMDADTILSTSAWRWLLQGPRQAEDLWRRPGQLRRVGSLAGL